MSASNRDKALQLTFIVMGLFLAGRLLGLGPLASVWSLAHWSATPLVALLIWAVVVALVGFLFFKKVDAVIAGSDRLIWVMPILFLLMAALLRFDSFAYGGGNLRIADFAQSSQIIYRWFEMGSVAVAGKLYQSLREFGIPTREAAVNGWVIWSLVSGLVSAIGATLLAKRLAESFMHRFMLSVIMLIGGHSLVLFGYTGVESSLPMFVIWFGLAANYYSSRRNAQALLLCWGLAALGLLFHISLLILIPGCVFLTLRHFGGKKPNRVPLVGALLTLVFLVVGLYVQSGRNLELQSVILLLSGKRPLGDYGLFSIRHLLDWFQIVFLGAPTAIIAAYLLWTHLPSRERADLIGAVSVVALSGLVAIFVLDPYHSVILDAPRLMAYLAPAALLLAFLVADRSGKSSAESRLLASPGSRWSGSAVGDPAGL
ncbi:MAG: hypothetical protein IPH75_01830 [bacterium]|nr:hypothetical protein [bacterium]